MHANMELPFADPLLATLPSAEQYMEISTAGYSAAGMASMFSHALNTHITGGSFNVTSNATTNIMNGRALDVLYRRVASNAITNLGGRADEVRCHPETRKEVINRIEKWGDMQHIRTAPVFWLSGPAGAGKSAIMQTIAERCKLRGVPYSNFFFFRADSTRSTASSLIATLVHQMVLLYPSLQDTVANAFAANPLIFDSSLEDQLVRLIVTPLRAIRRMSSTYRPLMILIDGLDECDSESKRSQQLILQAFDRVITFDRVILDDPSFCLLVASRDESQIRATFNRISSQYLHLYLDDEFSPDNDIRLFVNAQFKQIRKTHPLAYTLDKDWPSVQDVNYIVEKSSGQFIYAATVMRFIMDSSASPMLSLERVQGAARLATKSPFSPLDAIYTYILSQVEDQEALQDILRAQIIIKELQQVFPTAPPEPVLLMELLLLFNDRYNELTIISCLADLTPISWYQKNSKQLLFYHASFPDYLLDKSRSRDYFIDILAITYKTLQSVLALVSNGPCGTRLQWLAVSAASKLSELPLGSMSPLVFIEDVWHHIGPQVGWFIEKLYSQCTCDDDVLNFRGIMCQWINSDNVHTFDYNNIKHLPFSRRYFQMARADSLYPPDGEMTAAMIPETDLDRQESILWLNNLLCIYEKAYHRNPETYKQRLTEWISWAVLNDIPCGDLYGHTEPQ